MLKGTKRLHSICGYYSTWYVTINRLELGIPLTESKGACVIHLMAVLTTCQGKVC